MKRKNLYNPKRKPAPPPQTQQRRDELCELARRVQYDGNPEHKRNPGDFGLTPPSCPKRDKSLCDAVNIFQKSVAENLLKEGLQRGLVSTATDNGWPQNVWVLTPNGEPLEAQLGNKIQGIYHGYPLLENDALHDFIVEIWNNYGLHPCT